jgi:hypothetical protein
VPYIVRDGQWQCGAKSIATRTIYALASEIGLLAGPACVLARQLLTVAQKTTLVIGVGACRGPLDARCGAKSIGLFAMQRKSDRKNAF